MITGKRTDTGSVGHAGRDRLSNAIWGMALRHGLSPAASARQRHGAAAAGGGPRIARPDAAAQAALRLHSLWLQEFGAI